MVTAAFASVAGSSARRRVISGASVACRAVATSHSRCAEPFADECFRDVSSQQNSGRSVAPALVAVALTSVGMIALKFRGPVLECEARPAFARDKDETATESEEELRAIRAAIVNGDYARVLDWVRHHGPDGLVTASGQSVLSYAAEKGALHLVRALLAEGASYGVCDRQGFSALMYAARGGHAPVVHALLAARAAPDSPADIFGNSPIHGAVGFGHTQIARALLRAECDPNQRTGDVRAPESYGAKTLHEAPLHLACRAKPPHLEMRSRSLVTLLLQFNANPCLQDDRGDTPAHHLARKGDSSTLWVLLSRSPPELAAAAASGLPNERGVTALGEAIECGAPLAVRAALTCGPYVAMLRQRLNLPIEDNGSEPECGSLAEEATWEVYMERLDSGPKLLSFEEGGDGVRRRA